MKKTIRKSFRRLFIAGVLICTNLNLALAGDNLSLNVTCTIPVVAGINAPLLEEETVRNQEIPADTQKDKTKKNLTEELRPPMIQEDKEKNMPLINGQPIPITIRTFYSR